MEAILDDKKARVTAKGRYTRSFLVKWVGYEKPTWEKEKHLTCGRLLYRYFQAKKSINRSEALVMSDEEIVPTPTL